jgi:hypothetical protein
VGNVIDDRRLVFVAGLHRSGTTPLARVLAQHPQVSGLCDTGATEDEGQHLQSVYPPAKTYGGPGEFALDPRAHLTEHSALVSAANADQLLAAWLPHWDLSKRLLVEKSPPNLVMSRFLQALFPDASFVVVVRHPVAVTLATHKWRSHRSLDDLMANWFAGHDTFRTDQPHLRRVHVLKYEELVTSPRPTLDELGDFLGLDQPIPADLLRTDRSSEYESQWGELASSRRPWHRRRYEVLLDNYEQRANDYGYSLRDLAHVTPFPVNGQGTPA